MEPVGPNQRRHIFRLVCHMVVPVDVRQHYVWSISPGGSTGAELLFTIAGLFVIFSFVNLYNTVFIAVSNAVKLKLYAHCTRACGHFVDNKCKI